MKGELEFVFSFRSPYAWIASRHVLPMVHSEVRIRWTPFLPLPSMKDPVSRLHGWNDLLSKLPDTNGVDAIVCDNYGLAAQARWDARDDAIDIPIVSTDRPHIVPSGKWIILDQVGEWGDAKPKTMCDSIESLEDIILRRYDGEPVRTIRVSVGQNCR